MLTITIKENSWLGKRAAKYLKGYAAAIVFGKTIHLHNATKEYFLKDIQWVRHEVAHVKQYQRLGFVRFIVLYLFEIWRKGYYNNRFEVEARSKEHDETIMKDVKFV